MKICYDSATTILGFYNTLFLKSQRKNLEGLFTDMKHSLFFTFLAKCDPPENLQGLSCLGSRKIRRIPTLLNNYANLIHGNA